MAPRWRQVFGLAAFNLLRTQQFFILGIPWAKRCQETSCHGCLKLFVDVSKFLLLFAFLFLTCTFLVIATIKPECKSIGFFLHHVHSMKSSDVSTSKKTRPNSDKGGMTAMYSRKNQHAGLQSTESIKDV